MPVRGGIGLSLSSAPGSHVPVGGEGLVWGGSGPHTLRGSAPCNSDSDMPAVTNEPAMYHGLPTKRPYPRSRHLFTYRHLQRAFHVQTKLGPALSYITSHPNCNNIPITAQAAISAAVFKPLLRHLCCVSSPVPSLHLEQLLTCEIRAPHARSRHHAQLQA
eukprot:364925-Chlamydomonas_euryale.AAC.8